MPSTPAPLSLTQMAELPAEDWPTLQVRLLPSVQWLSAGITAWRFGARVRAGRVPR